jgi:tetratricopeptide (TPR) repeat protein
VIIPAGPQRPLPHLAYLEALAECEESTPRWHSLTAGYAVMRLFDLWVEHGCRAIPRSDLELRRVRKRLELISSGDPVRRCLTQLVEVIGRPSTPRGAEAQRLQSYEAGRILAAYGKLLQYESSWSLSRDVHETLIEHARGTDDVERLLDSMLMVAFCHRMLGQLDDAREAYTVLRQAATELESEQYLLLSELGYAKIAIQRGNLPAAAGMLDRILDNTQGAEHALVRSKALMDRARVATQLGDLTMATILGHQALECSTDPADRDRILINIGVNLAHMGLRDEARDAYLVAGASAQETTVRWLAQINLMELAYLDLRETTFEQYRRTLVDVELPPYMAAVYQEAQGYGFSVFKRYDEAEVAFRRMLDVAERHGLNEFIVKAERALGDVASVIPPLAVNHAPEPAPRRPDLTVVTESLSKMRELAGL